LLSILEIRHDRIGRLAHVPLAKIGLLLEVRREKLATASVLAGVKRRRSKAPEILHIWHHGPLVTGRMMDVI